MGPFFNVLILYGFVLLGAYVFWQLFPHLDKSGHYGWSHQLGWQSSICSLASVFFGSMFLDSSTCQRMSLSVWDTVCGKPTCGRHDHYRQRHWRAQRVDPSMYVCTDVVRSTSAMSMYTGAGWICFDFFPANFPLEPMDVEEWLADTTIVSS